MAVAQLAAKYGRADVAEIKASFRLHPGEMALTRKIDEWCEDSLLLLYLLCELAPERKDQIFREGLRFFARANYSRAGKAKSPFERCVAYLTVFKHFHYRYLPSTHHLLQVLYGTRLFDALRFIKRNLRHGASRV
jgi:hypothetical protein